jgi:hypothetical protein
VQEEFDELAVVPVFMRWLESIAMESVGVWEW